MKRPDEVEGGAPSSKDVRRDAYGPHSIEVLEGLECIRRRPGMYVGNVRDGSGLDHLVWEVVGNVIDEHLARRARRMSVDVQEGWVTIADDGAGIPIEPEPRSGRPAVEIVLTTLHAGPTRWGHFPHVHVTTSMHGVGLAAVSALSERLEVEVQRHGGVHRIAIERGQVVEPLARVRRTSRTGTRVRFRPDPKVFEGPGLDHVRIGERLRELAWLCPLLEIRWQGEVLPGKGGPAGWVGSLAPGAARGLATRRTIDDVEVDLALAWCEDGAPVLHSFVGLGRTSLGGTHVRGLLDGLVEAVAAIAPAATDADRRAAIERGLVAVVSVGLFQPQFGGPTKDKLVSPEACDATRRAARDALARQLAWTASPLRAFLASRLGG